MKKRYYKPWVLEHSSYLCDVCGDKFSYKDIAFSDWIPVLLPWKKVVLLSCRDCANLILRTGAIKSKYHNVGRKFRNVSCDQLLEKCIEDFECLG